MPSHSRARAALTVLVVVLTVGCTAGAQPADDAAAPAPVPTEVIAGVNQTFAVYRAAVAQGEGQDVLNSVTDASIDDLARVAEVARTGDEETIRTLPAAEQLLVLTYRLRPDLLDADRPFLALADAGLAGQDRSLGGLGRIIEAGDDLALGVITDPTTGDETPLRWRFQRDGSGWLFDLNHANGLVSQAIATAAARAELDVDDLVAATVVDLSGEDVDTVEALFAQQP